MLILSIEVVNVYQAKDSLISANEITTALFKRVQKTTTWTGSLKALLVFHRLTHTLGMDFVTIFSKQKLPDYDEHKRKMKDNYSIYISN